jgi:membrane protein implicated in regulation of membrane protease activity
MTVIILAVAAGFGINMLAIRAAVARPVIGVLWFGLNCVADVLLAAVLAAEGLWWLAAWMAVCAVASALMCRDYWNRRKRKRATALAGAKSRARIAALVARARQAARPRRVLRPVPGSAR